jgi:hypothetical protein
MHQLTDIQGVEQLFNMLSLAAQKLSELLAEMLRLCPRDQENNAFFNYFLLNKLSRDSVFCSTKRTWRDKQVLGARAGGHLLEEFPVDVCPSYSSYRQ